MAKSNLDKNHSQVFERYHLDAVDQALLRQLTEFPETTIQDLAALVGYSPGGIKKRLKRPALRKAIAEVQQSTNEALKSLAHLSIKRLKGLVSSKDEKIALNACKVALEQFSNATTSKDQEYQEVIYRSRFGEQGQLISEKEGVPVNGPKNTLELLATS